MNLNELARELTLDEGGKQPLTVAQVKEVLACLGRRWRRLGLAAALKEAAAIIERAGK